MRDAKNAANDGLNDWCGARAQFIYPTRGAPISDRGKSRPATASNWPAV